ncbi:MAG: 8-oxo-dGTP pyrophosphatase MutT (NUDIX family) [Paraglaciecola sp.]|jgi:8-oxo-dGTP pyrophosphatase MutT (NUDIX family)
MYKIYINDTPLFLVDKQEMFDFSGDERNLIAQYRGKRKSLLNYADMLENSSHYDSIVLYSSNYEQLVKDFWSHYKIVAAAGGVVYNEKKEVLLIFRLDSWDLPKGKIDHGESREDAAVREVQEETGIQNIELGDFLAISLHTYKNRKGKRVLKPTYWYRMTTTDTDLTPQLEENIEKAEWRQLGDFLATKPIIYGSILDILVTEVGQK